MNKKIISYIHIVFILLPVQGVFSQNLTLKMIGVDSSETSILNQLNNQPSHSGEESVFDEIDLVKRKLQKLGYFTNTLEKVTRSGAEFTAFFSLGPKTDQITIVITNQIKSEYQNYFFTSKDSVSMLVSDVERFIKSIINEFDEQGRSFSEITLINPKFGDKTLYLELSILLSKQRNIDKIIVKGYEQFPQAFVRRYFSVRLGEKLTREKLQSLSLYSKSIDFVKEIKPPEVLFKEDSTFVYLFLKRVKSSTMDGLLNFATKDHGSGLLVNGNLDLRLKNTLNEGEQLTLFWNRVRENNSEFRFGAQIPYVFNSAISPEFEFHIYRQDSTFVTTSFATKLDYQFNQRSGVFLSFSNEASNYFVNNSDSTFDSFSKTFWNVGYSFAQTSSDSKYDFSFLTEISFGFGSRLMDTQKDHQYKILVDLESNISISPRAYFHFKNTTGILLSDFFLTNELFRIGGANSIRGFNEQSIFTNQFSIVNIEYRYLTSTDSYLHSITDFGVYKSNSVNPLETLLSLGFGYLFSIDNNHMNLGYAVGVTPRGNFDLNQSKLIIRITSNF